MSPDTKVSLTIEDIAFGGEGVARLNGFVVFVPFVLPDEVVEAEITEVKKKFARARLLRVLRASPDRVAPECRYFGDCGGGPYQHAGSAAPLRIRSEKHTSEVQSQSNIIWPPLLVKKKTVTMCTPAQRPT